MLVVILKMKLLYSGFHVFHLYKIGTIVIFSIYLIENILLLTHLKLLLDSYTYFQQVNKKN